MAAERTFSSQKVVIMERSISIPEYYQKVESMPEDPPDSMPYLVKTEHAYCFLLIFPIQISESLPNTKEHLIMGIRRFLGENQGIIEVDANKQYAYSIVKTVKEQHGVQYALTYQKFYPDWTLNIQGYFDEEGTTGIRDTTIYEVYRRKGIVDIKGNQIKGWTRDPYDESITQGALMNLSEQERFDRAFPDFPLSMCRALVKDLMK